MEATVVPTGESWNVSDIFADDDAFAAARQALESRLPGLDRWSGRLASSAAVLAEALEEITEATEQFGLLRCYASLKADADLRDARHQAMRQEVELLATALSRRTAFLRPEILALEPGTIERFLADEPVLTTHRFFLEDLLRQRAHVLGPDEERIMAESGLITRTPPSLFQGLDAVELPRPDVRLANGETVTLTPVAFQRQRISQIREDRVTVFPAYFSAYASFKETFAQNLSLAVKSHIFRTRARHYDSCLDASLDADNVPVAVYRNLIRQVREHLPTLHRYFRLRARALGLDRLEYADLYCPLCDTPPDKQSPAEARQIVEQALAPLGEEYVDALASAFDHRWIDWHPGPGKRAGAYASGWAYRVHPYVLMNYTGDLNSVSTLAHEMGHAMHSWFSNRAQPFATADYSIFVAEVASTVNEALLNRHLRELARTDAEKRFLLGSYLDGIRGTLFRQTMFAEFELEIHERVERGEVLTGESLNALYLRLLREYHAHDDDVVHIAEDYAVEWAAIPHMHYNFYVYQYSTGIIAATALAEALQAGDGDARRRYLDFLRAGGSDYPLEVLRKAGVDLESARPYDAAFRAIERNLDEIEPLI